MRKDYNLEKRKYVIAGFIILIALIYVARLYSIQIDDDKYKNSADNNAFLKKTIYPSRGIIYGRNGELIVYNQPAYDVVMIPRDVEPFDTLDFCSTLNISIDDFNKRVEEMKKKVGYSTYTPQTLLTQLSPEDYGRLQEKLYRFPGFYIQQREIRQYNHLAAANVLGNIREVNKGDIERDPYYAPGDYCGDLGVEKSYDQYLRGVKGVEILYRDARGRIQGHYNEGKSDQPAIAGSDLTLSIDIELQKYAERLMVNKIGAVVAIEPETGEILAMVSAPTYDPTMLIGRDRGKNYASLVADKFHPLFDRALMAAYPPGSTFKPTQALILLEEGIINTSTSYPCYRGFINGGLRVGCHGHGSPISVIPAISTSCNAFFCWGLKGILDNNRKKYGTVADAFEVWKNHLVAMGYGYKLGIDLPSESRGFIPNSQFYNKIYGENHWSANTIISIAIGQGEILATPLQIANLAATISNRGWFITPHVVKHIGDSANRIPLDTLYTTKRDPSVNQRYYDYVIEGMRGSVLGTRYGATCRKANIPIPGIEVWGKTGTAQNPHGKDHSAFMGFAKIFDPADPSKTPKRRIAVCVYVENAGFGATFGVPIGRLVMEKYLTDTISASSKPFEQQMLSANTIQYAKPAAKGKKK